MIIDLVKKEDLTVIYSATLNNNEIAVIKKNKMEKLAKTAKVQGFRPGKVPLDMVEKMYGDSLNKEILEDAVVNAMEKINKDHKIDYVSKPQVDIKEFEVDKNLVIHLEYEMLPDLSFMDFSTINLEKHKVLIEDADVNEILNNLAEGHGKKEEVLDEKKKIEKGDIAVIDFLGKVDGVAFEGGKGESYPLEIGSNSFIPGFEDQLIGAKINDMVEVKVKFPDEYHSEDLKGKDSIFEVKVHKIQVKVKHELNDDLAKKLGMDSLEALKTNITSTLSGQFNLLENETIKKDLIIELDKIKDFSVPKNLLKQELEILESEHKHYLKHMEEHKKGAHGDHHHSAENDPYFGKTEEEVKDYNLKLAEKRIRLGIILQYVSRTNNIKLKDADLNLAIENEARKYGVSPRDVLKHYENNKNAMNALKGSALENKILDFMVTKAKIKENEISMKAYKEKNNIKF
jgi:trigger factor